MRNEFIYENAVCANERTLAQALRVPSEQAI